MFVLLQASLMGMPLLAHVVAAAPQCRGDSCNAHEEDRHSLLQYHREQSVSKETIYDCSKERCGSTCYLKTSGSWGKCDGYGVCKAYPAKVQCLQQCQGDSKTWTAGWGVCDTYARDKKNFNHCDSDRDGSGLSASMVCPECGKCMEITTTTTTTTAKPVCQGSSKTWTAGWGSCDSYAKGKKNFNHCGSDKDASGLSASMVCSECGSCATTTTSTTSYVLACLGDHQSWKSEYGPCWTYARHSPANNFPSCSTDRGVSDGLLASQVCAECEICSSVKATTSTTTPAPVCTPWGEDPWDPKYSLQSLKRARCCSNAAVVQCKYGQRCGYCPECANTGEDVWHPKWYSRPVFCCDMSQPLNCNGQIVCGQCPTTTTTTTITTTTSTATSTTTTTTEKRPKYKRAKRGKCELPYTFITSKAECEAAAKDLKLKDTGAGTEKKAESGTDAELPQGCYYKSKGSKNKRLYFRKKGSTSSSSKARRAICVLLA